MRYAIYKNIRDSVWKCILDFKIKKLPVDVLSIAQKANVKVIRNSLAKKLAENEAGKALTDGEKWIIIYDDTLSTEACRYAIAHELGHILLGHDVSHVKYGAIKELVKTPKSEEQANTFAVRLLCPTCFLQNANLNEASEIAEHCKVPYSVAKQRARRMRELKRRNKFFTDPMEIETLKQLNRECREE